MPPKKSKPSQGDSHSSLSQWTWYNDSATDVFTDHSWTPCNEGESKGEEGMPVAVPAAKKRCVSNLYCPGCCGTLLFSSMWHNYLKDLHKAQLYSSRSGYQELARRKRQRIIQDLNVNGGLWYGVPIFTFWQDQVDKGAMPEPDMEHNYIRLYKTHKNSFQIMLTQSQRDQHQRRNK